MKSKRPANSRPKLTSFARLLFAQWRKLKMPMNTEPIVVAVSGGADSTALLLALDELNHHGKISVEVHVAHLDHGLRKSSGTDAHWVGSLSKKLGYKVVISKAKVHEVARLRQENLEQVARKLRYEFLERTARKGKSRFVLTAHTMDDQAETVLLRLMRGSASLGLSGIEALRPLSRKGDIQLARPLLWARRSDTEDYCRLRQQEFLVDEMNADETFARVKVRNQLLPLMQSFNQKVVEAISRTATLLRDDHSELDRYSADLLAQATEHEGGETNQSLLNIRVLSDAPPALRRRALRQWITEKRGNARRLEMVHLTAVERLIEGSVGGKVVELPDGARVKRLRGRLEFEQKSVSTRARIASFRKNR